MGKLRSRKEAKRSKPALCQSQSRALPLEYGPFDVSYRLTNLSILRVAVLEWAEPLVWVEIWVLGSASEWLLA
jgi:hypothetical protein